MILQGVEAVNKAQELVSSKKEPPFWDRWPLVYSSATVSLASEDAEMWFSADSFYPLEDALRKENLVFALPADNNLSKNVKEVLERKNLMLEVPAGNIWGGSTEEKLKYIVHSKKIDFTVERANQRFLLINPKAVQDGIMPKLLSIIEKKCYYIRGLKQVRKSDASLSVAWSDDKSSSPDETHKEESGIALSDDKSSSSGNTHKEEFGIALVLSLPACMLLGEDSIHIRDR